MSKLKGIFIDLETGGLDPKVHGLTEIGAVAFEVDVETGVFLSQDTFQRYVAPQTWLAYAPGALSMQMNGEGEPMTLDWLGKNGVDQHEAWRWLYTFVGHHAGYGEVGPLIWSQNADFDHGFVHALFRRVDPENGISAFPSDRCDWSCTRKLFTLLGSLGAHTETNPSMKTIRRVYRLSDEGVHTALGDARTGVRALAAMLRHLSETLG